MDRWESVLDQHRSNKLRVANDHGSRGLRVYRFSMWRSILSVTRHDLSPNQRRSLAWELSQFTNGDQ